jgi:PKD repeat protein
MADLAAQSIPAYNYSNKPSYLILPNMEISKKQNGNKIRVNKQITNGFLIFLCFLVNGKTAAQTADFTVNSTGSCTPIAINLTDKSIGATSWLWDFGNSNTATSQNASINYVQPGAYTVSLTINGDPKLVSKKTINAYPKPNPTIPIRVQGCEPFSGTIIADATPVTIAPFSINDTSVGGITGGQPLTYTWNFSGALPTVTQNSPILALTNVPAGSYDLLLTVTDEHGCSGSIFKESAILISPKPTADFTITKANLCGTGNVSLSATAGVAGGSIANYAWDINNDGTIESTLKDYTHNFTTAGTYNIALTASSDLQCSSTKVIKQVTFNPNNTIDFTYSGSCAGQAVNFTDQSSATAIKWEWDFDNNGTVDSGTQNPSYSYTTAGIKTAKLKVTFSDECEKTLTKSITINGATSAFSYSTALACPPTYTIGFTSAATASAGSNITSYAWDFDNDGKTDDVSKNPSHDFNAVGTFPVRLTITTDKGCAYSQQSSVTIDSTVVDLKVDTASGCAPLLTKFTAVYKNLLDPIASYNWNFGDGQTSTQANPSHNYTVAGKYDVTLSIITARGCVAQKKTLKMVSIGSPQAITNITYTQADSCQKSPVNFIATINNKIDQLIWDFGDNTIFTQTLKPATKDTISTTPHIYLKPGIQTIKVKAISNGCESLTDFTLGGILIKEPTASFTASSNIECKLPTANISFTNNSISKDADTSWDWDFGDGTPNAITKNPSHIYTKAGDFKVMLTVSNSATGCVAKDSSMIYVTTVNPKFSANNTTTCVRDTLIFTNLIASNSSSNYKATAYSWDFGDPASGGCQYFH